VTGQGHRLQSIRSRSGTGLYSYTQPGDNLSHSFGAGERRRLGAGSHTEAAHEG